MVKTIPCQRSDDGTFVMQYRDAFCLQNHIGLVMLFLTTQHHSQMEDSFFCSLGSPYSTLWLLEQVVSLSRQHLPKLPLSPFITSAALLDPRSSLPPCHPAILRFFHLTCPPSFSSSIPPAVKCSPSFTTRRFKTIAMPLEFSAATLVSIPAQHRRAPR